MPNAEKLHPTQLQLQTFAQGRLSADELAEMEIHIRDCNVCCRNLANVQPTTVLQNWRGKFTRAARSRLSRYWRIRTS